jgi:glucose-6-phosphate isomerase
MTVSSNGSGPASQVNLFERSRRYRSQIASLGLTLDVSRMRFDDDFLERMGPAMEQAFVAMDALEGGAMANPDERRMVGHYWLRSPERAPSAEIAEEIRATIAAIQRFTTQVHRAEIRPPAASQFRRVLSIGIGGSALGPMLVADALGQPGQDRMSVEFIDNTDPEGIARGLAASSGRLAETLTIVTSKSGGTPETRNGMLLVADAYRLAGLDFSQHAVAITMPGSQLDKMAEAGGWLARFPMFDWVGGRTSVLSAVGLLPAALQGLDIDGLLAGAALADTETRQRSHVRNPAAMMALMWHHATEGKGRKDLVVLPYKDRLLLFSRYLQQLIMESLGKQYDLHGQRVEQGLTVYGNKGSTDQHAYVQQLREGVPNFFALFIRVLESGGSTLEVEPGVTAGDYLHGFLLGTRQALYENGRESMMISVPRIDARVMGGLIALFERAVGFYATLVGINAYHQPGVEAGKKAAAHILGLQVKVQAALTGTPRTAQAIAAAVPTADVEAVSLLLEHLSANHRARRSEEPESGEILFRAD